MKSYRIALVLLAAVLPAGCHNNVNQQLLEREIRRQEDQIYALEDELDDYECQLASVQNENSALRKQLSTGDRGALDSPGAPIIDMPGAPATPPRRREPAGGGPGGPMIEPNVEIDPGEEFDPTQTPASGAASSGRIVDQTPQRIVLNRQLTGGLSGNGGGVQGVLVVFEPRNKAGQMLELPGDVSIAVLDPQKQGPQARVARWDFTAEEAQSHLRKTALGRGFHFELPWPSAPPTNRRLQVFVRYITPDGRKLVADMHIDASGSGDREARRWHSAPAGSRRALGAGRSEAPPYTAGASSVPTASVPTASVPTAKFLDPPVIVPESEESGRSRPGSSRSYEDEEDGETREAVRKKQAEATSSRPVWSPFR